MKRDPSLLSLDGTPVLQQISGEGRGSSYELSIDEVKIGRADQNDIVISHESISREHARIEKGQDGRYVIFDSGSKNGLIVNGQKTEAAPLKDGDVLQIGAFAFKFTVPAPYEEQALQEVGQHVPAYGEAVKSTPAAGPRSKRPIIYGALGLILVVVYFFSNQTPNTETTTTDNKTETDPTLGGNVAERFQASTPPPGFVNEKDPTQTALEDPTLKSAEQDIAKLDFSNQSIQEAELYFRRGQREYFNRNWQRAIDSFSTSLAISKKHPTAEFYLKAAIHEAEKEAKTQMEMGVKYFDSLQYKRSIYHFNQVINLLAHRTNEKVVADCKKYIDVAQRKLQASELFP